MKKVLFFVTSLLTLNVYATVRTVSNNPSTIAQFSTIQAAIDASVSGDSIYVHGSPNNYAGFNIVNKRVTIIGTGYNPNKALPFTSNVISQCTFSGVGASGSELHGLSFFTSLSVVTNGVTGIRFIRNRIHNNLFYMAPGGGGTLSGYVFESNWFENSGVISNNSIALENIIFQNNLFYHTGVLSNLISGFVNSVNVLFDHNLFYGPSAGSRDVFSSVRFVTLSNNIFVRTNAAGAASSSFYNNVTFNTANNSPWTVNGNFDGGGNLAGVDPQMDAQASVNNGVNDPLLDFSIADGPANNSGSDGKDRGLLFETVGSLNWTNSRTSRLPYIYSMQTNTPTVAPGGSITVTVEARTSN